VNVPPSIAAVIAFKPEVYPALCETLGVEHLYDVLEVISVDLHNARIMARKREQQLQRRP
jgi:hypothetical protein